MACGRWGRSTSTTRPPAFSSTESASRKRAICPSSTPSFRKPQGTPIRAPRPRPASAAVKSGTGKEELVESSGSWPQTTEAARARSSTLRAKGPIWSREEAKATRP